MGKNCIINEFFCFFSLRGEMDFSNEMEIFYEMEPQNVHIKSKYAIASFLLLLFFFFFFFFFFLLLLLFFSH